MEKAPRKAYSLLPKSQQQAVQHDRKLFNNKCQFQQNIRGKNHTTPTPNHCQQRLCGKPRFPALCGNNEVSLPIPTVVVSEKAKWGASTLPPPNNNLSPHPPVWCQWKSHGEPRILSPCISNKAPLSLPIVSMETEWKAQISIPAQQLGSLLHCIQDGPGPLPPGGMKGQCPHSPAGVVSVENS